MPTFARPLTPTHEVPSGKRIVTEIPGIPYRSRSWSSRFCRARRVAAVAVRPARSGGRTPIVATTGRAAKGGDGAGFAGFALAGRRLLPTSAWAVGSTSGVGRAAAMGSGIRDAVSTGPSATEMRLVATTVARIRRARRTTVRRGRTAAMRSARYRESVTGTIPRMPDDTDARSAPSLLRTVGLLPDGPLPWGRPVPGRSPGVFLVELPAPLPTAPIELTRVGKWLEHVPGLRLDGARPTSRALSARLASFWLPSQTVLDRKS